MRIYAQEAAVFRDQRQDDQAERQPEAVGDQSKHSYQMRQRLLSVGDDFWIEDAHGTSVYKVDGQALRIRRTLRFEDAHGNVLCTIQERRLHLRKSMAIVGPTGQRLGLVTKARISPLRDRLTVAITDGPQLDVTGNILDHEYTIGEGRNQIAAVSKRWVRVRDTYGVEIEPGQDDVLVLAVTVCIDQLTR
jgi:uncharacterized protein YxjI